jgi:hypothetical protein
MPPEVLGLKSGPLFFAASSIFFASRARRSRSIWSHWFVVVDGLAVECRLEESLDFGEGVEPIGDRFGFFAVLQAEVDLLAEIVRQPRDFAISSHIFFIFFTLIHPD